MHDMTAVIIFSAAFVLAGMAMVLLVWRDSRPRTDDWRTIIRRADLPPRKDPDDVGMGPTL